MVQETPQDDDNTIPLDSPIVIDLTYQSQSLADQQELNCNNSASFLQTPSSPDILQNDVTVSPTHQVPADVDDIDSLPDNEEAMETDEHIPSSFCLQVSPSQRTRSKSPTISEQPTSQAENTETLSDTCSDSIANKQNLSPLNSVEISLQNIPATIAQSKTGINSSTLIPSTGQGPLYESFRDVSDESCSEQVKSAVTSDVKCDAIQQESQAPTPTGNYL